MTDHDPAHEDLIERWLAGEIADDAAEWRALMDESPALRERVRELDAVRATLDRAIRMERDVLAEALEAPAASGASGAPSDSRASTTPGAGVAPSASDDAIVARRTTQWWRGPWGPLAAAAVLGLLVTGVVLVRPWAASGPPAGILLGDGLELVAPITEVEAYGTFTWRDPSPVAGVQYVVVVTDAVDSSVEVARSDERSVTSWTPPDTAAWPAAIRWTVTAFDIEGERVATGAAVARRR